MQVDFFATNFSWWTSFEEVCHCLLQRNLILSFFPWVRSLVCISQWTKLKTASECCICFNKYNILFVEEVVFFYRTQVYLGSDLWVQVSLTDSVMFCWLNWCNSGWWRYQLNSSWWYQWSNPRQFGNALNQFQNVN